MGNVDDEWDLFQDSDIYKDTDLYPFGADNTKSESLYVPSKERCIHLKPLKLHAPKDTSEKLQVTDIHPEALIGKISGACIAAFGPQNLIAVGTPSNPILLKSTSALGSLSTLSCEIGLSDKKRRATCLLFIAKVEEGKKRHCWDSAYVSHKFFDVLAGEFRSTNPEYLLLQGNMAGQVHIFPVKYPKQTSSSFVFYELKQPVQDLIAVPFHEKSDAVLVVGSDGHVVAVFPSVHETTGSAFLPIQCGPPFAKSFQTDLKDGFITFDWKFGAPLNSPIMIGSEYLCFCSASKVCIAKLFEITGDRPSHQFMHESLVSRTLSTGPHGGGLAFNRSTSFKCVQIADVVIAVVGKGSLMPASKTKCLIALTSRGRLLQLDISEHALASDVDCTIMTAHCKNWKSGIQQREDYIQEMIQEIAMIEKYSETFLVKFDSMNFAINELSFALRLAFDVLRNRRRQLLLAPYLPFPAFTIPGVQCSLEATPFVSNIPAERLHLGFSPEFLPSGSCGDFFDDHSDLSLQIKIFLTNHSSYPVSPYWTLILGISNAEATTNSGSTTFSSIINDGYGLAPGGKCVINFHVVPPRQWPSPLVACIYLCHTQENHINVSRHSLINSMEDALARYRVYVSENAGRGYITDLCHRVAIQDHPQVLNATPGAVGVLLATYRLDILSLIRPPRKPQCSYHIRVPISSHFMTAKEGTTDTVHAEAELIGPFSGKLQLSCIKEDDILTWNGLNAAQKWQEFFLEEFNEYCNVSKNGNQLTTSDHKGGTISLSLDHNATERKGWFCRELQISTSSLLLGSAVREAILWRLSKQKSPLCMNLEEQEQHQSVYKKKGVFMSEKHNHMLSVVIDTQQSLEIAHEMELIGDFWKSMRSESCDMSKPSVKHAWAVVKGLIEDYRRYRENVASDPYFI